MRLETGQKEIETTMVTSDDLHGIVGMMPAFATPDANNLEARSTVDVNNLKDGVDRIIRDGVNVIATTGSFGECHTLLIDELATLARATVEAAAKRVPVFIGCTSPNARDVVEKMKLIREAGADGVLLGVPYYLPSSVDNAVQFYHDICDLFPDLAILIYHNPRWHRVTLPVEAFARLTERKNIVAMKDSHRDEETFQRLTDATKGKMSIFPGQHQYYPYCKLGAAGCWSIDVWMGPWPMIALRNAIDRGDYTAAEAMMKEFDSGQPMDVMWREVPCKISIKAAGYCDPGPLRPPFVHVPDNVVKDAVDRAEQWKGLCRKYRPLVEAATAA